MHNDPVVCDALGDLYYSTTGYDWQNNTGWSGAAEGSPTDYCTINGCTCADDDGVLTMLCVCARRAERGCLTSPTVLRPAHSSLQNNQLNGSIPASLGDLTSLRRLCVHTRESLVRPPYSNPPCCSQLLNAQLPPDWDHSGVAGPLDQSGSDVRARASRSDVSLMLPSLFVLRLARRFLSYTQLSGTIPDSLGRLTSVVTMCVRARVA